MVTDAIKPIIYFVGLISYSLYLYLPLAELLTRRHGRIKFYGFFGFCFVDHDLLLDRSRSGVAKLAIGQHYLRRFCCLYPAGISSSWIINRGSPDRMPQIIAELSQNYKSTRTCITKTKTKCVLDDVGKQQIFLVGDSHMHSLENALLAHTQAFDYKLTSLVFPGCQYILNLSRVNINNGQPHKCNRSIQMSRREVLLNSEPGIIIGGRLPVVLQEDGFDNLEGGYEGKMPFALLLNRLTCLRKLEVRRSKSIRKQLWSLQSMDIKWLLPTQFQRYWHVLRNYKEDYVA